MCSQGMKTQNLLVKINDLNRQLIAGTTELNPRTVQAIEVIVHKFSQQ